MKAVFSGGPLDGQERELVAAEMIDGRPGLWYELHADGRLIARNTPPALHPHYTLHFIDKRGVAHYYIPTS